MAGKSSKKNNLESFYAIIILSFSMITYIITNSLTAVIMVAATILVCIIFILFLLNRKKIRRLKNSGISDIDQMDGFQFEYYLNELFKSNGYTSQVTKSRGDYGADLILKRDGEVIAVQAKRHSKPVGIKAIQEITAAKGYYKANKAWVVTNNSFTKQAINLASSLEVKLIGREELIKLILKMNPNASISTGQILNTVTPKRKKCKECGGDLVVKKGAYGRFYGCSNYPRCKNTEKL